ncbi:MAG TPA: diaminopimelate epimerase [Blastocatellia bacterium]|nr:diaminopimelate epimerase [Blastocatellia bacterium]
MIEFCKLQAMGNDFLVTIVEDVNRVIDTAELARRICSRNFGAGADGLIVVDRKGTEEAAFASRIFNSDGTEAEISGNGTRCVAAYLYWAGMWNEPEIAISTAAGIKRGVLRGMEGLRFDFTFDMGQPKVGDDSNAAKTGQEAQPGVDEELVVGGETVRFTEVSMGNPHCGIFLPELDDASFNRLGPLVESHPRFPHHTNVEFIKPISDSEIEVRFWERGVGPTMSSGTGSCAATVASVMNGKSSRRVTVHTAGGNLEVYWREDGRLMLTASAEVVYRGEWLSD